MPAVHDANPLAPLEVLALTALVVIALKGKIALDERPHWAQSAVMTESVGVLVSVCSRTTTTLVSRPASSCLTLATVETTPLVSGSVQSMSAKTTATLGSTFRCFFIQFLLRIPLGTSHS